MRYLPYFLVLLATIGINFLTHTVVLFIAHFGFGYGGAATMDKYEWVVWLTYFGLAFSGLYSFSKLKRCYGGQQLLFTLSCWVLVIILEWKGISVMTFGAWLGDQI